MLKRRIKWLIIACWFLPFPAHALDEVSCKAKLDKTEVKLGEPVQYLVSVDYAEGTLPPALTPPSFVQFQVVSEHESIQSDPEDPKHKKMKKNWVLEPTSIGRLSIASTIVTFQDPVTNLLKNGKTDVMFVNVIPPEPQAAGNSQTASGSLAIGWIILPVIAAMAAGVWFWRRRGPVQGPAAESRPEPEAEASAGLQQAIGLAEAGEIPQYFTALTRSLLGYLQMKHGWAAQGLSTPALLSKLKGLGLGQQLLDEVRNFFQVADQVKFAGYAPGEDELIRMQNTIQTAIETIGRLGPKK